MWRVQFYKNNYDEREHQAVGEVLNSGWLTMSQKTFDFESSFSAFLGNGSKCLAVSSCTSALHMALLALGIKQGDEVITPALTFIADQNVVEMCGAKNVLADITSMEDWSVDPCDIESKITEKTKAIMIVHYAGYACDMDSITALCKKRNLFLIEDCAHTPGASYNNKPLGTFGDISAFSFFANKNIAAGEGGMIVTQNAELYEKLKNLRSHGMSVLSFDRYNGRAVSYDVGAPGLNYRITEIASALCLVQLSKLEGANNKRQKLVELYNKQLSGVPHISIPYKDFSRGSSSYHIMPILLAEKIDRAALIESMKNDGVQTSIHYPAIKSFTAYKDKVLSTPKAEYVSARELTLPLYPGMTEEDVDIVCDSLIKGITRSAES
ncbi:MAG: DegT/DnrJ/EryC1/StrS family aminotransferase [Treponema sp.]|jgi:dTDP-4-amino-4,6-dideoxygalactose transaminase|nr:DegT/DnrJ/EryC1/StrS family aminotransferase [Treponema sp.]